MSLKISRNNEGGGDLCVCVSCRFSPLHHAALNGNVELITLLLESQAAVDIRDQKGERRARKHTHINNIHIEYRYIPIHTHQY